MSKLKNKRLRAFNKKNYPLTELNFINNMMVKLFNEKTHNSHN